MGNTCNKWEATLRHQPKWGKRGKHLCYHKQGQRNKQQWITHLKNITPIGRELADAWSLQRGGCLSSCLFLTSNFVSTLAAFGTAQSVKSKFRKYEFFLHVQCDCLQRVGTPCGCCQPYMGRLGIPCGCCQPYKGRGWATATVVDRN